MTNKTVQVVSIKDIEHAIVSKLNGLGHQHDEIFRELSKLRKERDEAIADFRKSQAHCRSWIKLFTVATWLLTLSVGICAWLIIQHLK